MIEAPSTAAHPENLEPYDLLVLSPHLDDGVLSCGAELHALTRTGGRGIIVTFFTADVPPPPNTRFTEQVFHYMNLEVATGMAERRAEDIAACQELGVDWQHLPFNEAICRRIENPGAPFPYDSGPALFGTPDPDDAATLGTSLANALSALAPAKKWLAPLGFGGHVDHRLLRRAAERHVQTHLGSESPELLFYEDFPYALKLRNRLRVLGWRTLTLGGHGRGHFRSQSMAVTEKDLDRKIQAIARYTSQVRPLFGSHKKLDRSVRRYSRKVGGERLWSLNS